MEKKINDTFAGAVCDTLLEGVDKNKDPGIIPALLLAYVGDSIFDLAVRTMFIKKGSKQVNKINNEVTGFVSAAAQARMADAIKKTFTPEEAVIYQRGRNAKPKTKAKNASQNEYHKATGLEAVFGYLYLKGERDRLLELIKEGIAEIENRREK